MPNWINGGGFWLVQSTEPYNAERIKQEMEALEQQIQAAERYWAAQKERTA
ncbi:hypothetical protein ACFPRA_01465 [Sporosarcina soli]|uniref:Uncharacterized protein n=1 Tax=Sporosarcina soli TaxID=334736 RepID=A0ABW0TDR0_9BACL